MQEISLGFASWKLLPALLVLLIPNTTVDHAIIYTNMIIANLVPYKKRTAEKWNLSDISWPLTNQCAIPLFFTVSSEKSGIARWLVRADWSERSTRIVAMESSKRRELDLESFVFFSYSLQRNMLHMTSTKKQKDNALGKESVTIQLLVSQPPPYEQKKSQPAAVMTRREQQEATTHCGSEFENKIFWL